MKRALPLPPSRLLTLGEAAAYCRLSRGLFEVECKVRPIIFGRNTVRFDRCDLDEWIDRRKAPVPYETDDEILAKLNSDPPRKRRSVAKPDLPSTITPKDALLAKIEGRTAHEKAKKEAERGARRAERAREKLAAIAARRAAKGAGKAP